MLWVGEEDYTKYELLAYLRSEAPNLGYDIEVYSAGEDSPSEVLGRAATPSLLGEKNILVLTEIERCSPSERSYLKRHEGTLSPGLILIAIASSGVDSEDDLIQSLAQHATLLRFSLLSQKDLAAWAKEKAKALGLDFEDNALAGLSVAFKDQIGRLSSEIEKISLLYPQGGQISVRNIEKMLGASVWETTEKITLSIRECRLKEALQALEERRFLGEKAENALTSIFYEAASLPGSEENLETLYNADLSLKTGVASESVIMPLVLGRIVHPALRKKEEKTLWLK